MPLILVIDHQPGGTARVLAPIQRSGFQHELFTSGDAALQHIFDPFFALMAHVIVVAPSCTAEQASLLRTIATHRPELGPRMILVTERSGDEQLAALAARLSVHAVLTMPFGVEELADAIGSCVALTPRRLAASSAQHSRG
jgi:DNA-binding NtrC family response regulator